MFNRHLNTIIQSVQAQLKIKKWLLNSGVQFICKSFQIQEKWQESNLKYIDLAPKLQSCYKQNVSIIRVFIFLAHLLKEIHSGLLQIAWVKLLQHCKVKQTKHIFRVKIMKLIICMYLNSPFDLSNKNPKLGFVKDRRTI